MNEAIRKIDYNYTLTPAMLKAIDYIGRHRKTDVKPRRKACAISIYMANKLVKYHFAMWWGDTLMLTVRGERIFTALHPHSKWAIS